MEMIGVIMRTKNTLKNIAMNFLNSIVLNLLRFASRIVFVKVISEIYLGVNGLLSNVLGLLALSELGISTAIGFSLYKPLADKDDKKIGSLMKFYQKAYRIIFIVVVVSGLILLPFLPYLIKEGTDGIEHLNIIYIIFLANMAISYLFSYKRTLISADQKNYKITPFLILYNFITTVLQIIVLLLFKNYIIYLLIQTLCIVLENITVNHYINKQYPLLNDLNKADKLDKKELHSIKKNIEALMLHKVGAYVVTSTDNIIITKYIGIITTGIYSNYSLIIGMISNFIYTLINNTIASFGNLVASEKPEKRLRVFRESNFICYVLYGVSALCLVHLLSPFIGYVFGEKFVIDKLVVYIICINFYIAGITLIANMVQTASGLYRKDKYVPLAQAIINLVVSIVLAKRIGLAGVFIGTFVSSILPFIFKPCIIYKYVFERSVYSYFKEFVKETVIIMVSFFVSNYLISLFNTNIIIEIIVRLIFSVCVPVSLIYICYRHTEEYKDVLGRIKSILKRKKG